MQDEKQPQAFPYCGVGDDLNYSRGMTMRDYFAAKAMQGIIAAGKYAVGMDQQPETTQYAEKAYRQADAMMRARSAR